MKIRARHILRFLNLFLFCYLGALATSEAQTNILTPREFRELEHVSLSIINRYPPSEYQYVFFGRGLTPVLAYFDSVFGKEMISIPLSNVKGLKGAYRRDAELREKLFDHFDRYCAGRLNGKKILLVDRVSSGQSMREAADAFGFFMEQRHLDSTRNEALVRGLGIYLAHTKDGLMDSNRFRRVRDLFLASSVPIDTLTLINSVYPQSLSRDRFEEEFAKYGRFYITGSDPRTVTDLMVGRMRGEDYDGTKSSNYRYRILKSEIARRRMIFDNLHPSWATFEQPPIEPSVPRTHEIAFHIIEFERSRSVPELQPRAPSAFSSSCRKMFGKLGKRVSSR